MPTIKKTPAKKTASTRKTVAKKVATKKQKIEIPAWSTIHVFGYGETQIIGNKANGKVANTQLKSLVPLFTAIAKKQQKGTKINLDDTHALNMFNGSFVDFRPKPMSKNNGQRLAWAEVDTKAINKFADELMSKLSKEKNGGRLFERMMDRGNLLENLQNKMRMKNKQEQKNKQRK